MGQAWVATGQLNVDANKQPSSGPENARVILSEGNVYVRASSFRLQADKITVYEAENRVLAEGNVVFDQADFQRNTSLKAEWNYRTQAGYFIHSSGCSNQAQDGTRICFTAERADKPSLDTIIATNVQVTACHQAVLKWRLSASKARIKTGDRLRIYAPQLRLKKIKCITGRSVHPCVCL